MLRLPGYLLIFIHNDSVLERRQRYVQIYSFLRHTNVQQIQIQTKTKSQLRHLITPYRLKESSPVSRKDVVVIRVHDEVVEDEQRIFAGSPKPSVSVIFFSGLDSLCSVEAPSAFVSNRARPPTSSPSAALSRRPSFHLLSLHSTLFQNIALVSVTLSFNVDRQESLASASQKETESEPKRNINEPTVTHK